MGESGWDWSEGEDGQKSWDLRGKKSGRERKEQGEAEAFVWENPPGMSFFSHFSSSLLFTLSVILICCNPYLFLAHIRCLNMGIIDIWTAKQTPQPPHFFLWSSSFSFISLFFFPSPPVSMESHHCPQLTIAHARRHPLSSRAPPQYQQPRRFGCRRHQFPPPQAQPQMALPPQMTHPTSTASLRPPLSHQLDYYPSLPFLSLPIPQVVLPPRLQLALLPMKPTHLIPINPFIPLAPESHCDFLLYCFLAWESSHGSEVNGRFSFGGPSWNVHAHFPFGLTRFHSNFQLLV